MNSDQYSSTFCISNTNDKFYQVNQQYKIGDFSENVKKAKWTSEAKNFFKCANDNSLILDVVISLSCRSQTGKPFEELVNALNDPQIFPKIKKINILDTTYLYRHFFKEFEKHIDASIPTDWYLSNREAINRLIPEVELKSWATEIDTDDYRNCYKKILQNFRGDEDGNGLVLAFRDTVISEASINSYKHKKDIKDCINFILEECAHLLSFFKDGANIVYPMKLYAAGDYIIGNNNLKINHLSYKVESEAEPNQINFTKKPTSFAPVPNLADTKTTTTVEKISAERKQISGLILQNRILQMRLAFYDNFTKLPKKEQYVFTVLALSELVKKKKEEHQNTDIQLNMSYDPSAKYTFIAADPNKFSQNISDLIDIAIKNCQKHGLISVKFFQKDVNAVLEIVNKGDSDNKAILTFPIAKNPDWVLTKLDFCKEDILVVLDTDPASERQWKRFLRECESAVRLEIFSCENSAINFINSLSAVTKRKMHIFMNLESSNFDFMSIVEQLIKADLIKQVTIMTAAYHNVQLQEVLAISGAKMLPKQLMKGIEVRIVR